MKMIVFWDGTISQKAMIFVLFSFKFKTVRLIQHLQKRDFLVVRTNP